MTGTVALGDLGKLAELDEVRRARLAERIAGAEQVLVTAAVVGDVPAALAGRRFVVDSGEVTLDGSDADA